jgi:hypothetical protein
MEANTKHKGKTMEPITTDDIARQLSDHLHEQSSSLIDNCNIRLFEKKDWSWHSVLYASTRHGMSSPIDVQTEQPARNENTETND